MKVLIMAAGVGSRISRYLQGQPKCCVDVDGKPLIRHTIELLNKKGITDIVYCLQVIKKDIFIRHLRV